jgi:hypothetical protein
LAFARSCLAIRLPLIPAGLPIGGRLLALRLSFGALAAVSILQRILAFIRHVLAMVVVVIHHVFPVV